ncbi:LemA family protein [Botrimarina hoheduenensis]|uniref:LemA family protein n=1 Tax=Botrimarina hoheduenensis TaxID=2528000 RepID=A0A5C5W8N8_9BACT|nr:LemA family protein [Botrimarina hoheduenensis]TWT46623.1 LemA family protein [Botrimarina hoheduenensis]
MPEALIAIAFLLTPLLIGSIWGIAVFNQMVGVRQHLRESWSDIEVELRRRLDLIPNLVETAKGYAAHERELLETVARLRTAATDPSHAGQRGEEERRVEAESHRLIALAETYPDLKANEQFLRLQHELTVTEDRIAAARRFYNGNVRDLNQLREQFPTSLIAALAGVEAAEYFQPDYASR